MKALVHNPYWDSLGGGERYTSEFVRLLLDKGWQVDIIWKSDISPSIKDRFGIDISKAKFIDTSHKKLSVLTLPYDLVFWLSDGSLPFSLAKSTIIHLQFPFKDVGGKSLSNSLKTRFYTFVVNSQFTKGFIDREYGIKSRVIYPPVSLLDFSPGKKANTILYVGRFSGLTQSKNHHVLIDSFAQIAKKHSGWELILAGGAGVGTTDEYLDSLKKSAAKLPVKIVTNPSLDQLKSFYAQTKVFWSASGLGVDQFKEPVKTEHFGISVVEAMAAGCVPVLVNAGGFAEIVDHDRNGYLWTDTRELLAYTQDIIASSVLWERLSRNAIEKSKIFSTTKFRESFTSLLKL